MREGFWIFLLFLVCWLVGQVRCCRMLHLRPRRWRLDVFFFFGDGSSHYWYPRCGNSSSRWLPEQSLKGSMIVPGSRMGVRSRTLWVHQEVPWMVLRTLVVRFHLLVLGTLIVSLAGDDLRSTWHLSMNSRQKIPSPLLTQVLSKLREKALCFEICSLFDRDHPRERTCTFHTVHTTLPKWLRIVRNWAMLLLVLLFSNLELKATVWRHVAFHA